MKISKLNLKLTNFYTVWQDPKTRQNRVKNGSIIKSLSSDENYKYFGILEADNIMHTKVKELTEREYIKRRKNLKFNIEWWKYNQSQFQ